MSSYRFLADHWIGTQYILAGTTAATRDVGGTLPVGWQPSGAVDPLDGPAVNAFYAAGPQPPPLTRTQFSTQFVAPPTTYWRATSLPAVPGASGATQWQLTGLGVGLPPIVT